MRMRWTACLLVFPLANACSEPGACLLNIEPGVDIPPRVVTLAAADERSGRYTVHIEAEGYQAWDTAGVRATEGSCHVQTARFTRLTPAT
jgi:hypothetical protein